jgi:peptidyl-Asp metalloendopeptidase
MDNPKSWLLKTAVAILLMVAGLPAMAEQPYSGRSEPGAFVAPTHRKGTVPKDESPTVIRAINVLADTGQLTAGSENLRLIIFDNRPLDLVQDRIEPIPDKGLIWYGKVANEPQSFAILTLIRETVTGDIDTESGNAYQIRYVGGGVHSFRELDRTKFPDDAQPLRSELDQPLAPFLAVPCGTDPATDIDALVVYTPAARMAAGGQDAMEGIVYSAVAYTNIAYRNSNINQRLRLAHVEEVSYTESGNSETDLDRLTNSSDGLGTSRRSETRSPPTWFR